MLLSTYVDDDVGRVAEHELGPEETLVLKRPGSQLQVWRKAQF